MKREEPVDFVTWGAVSLPIRYSPVKSRVIDPSVPRVKGQPPTYVEKVYDSFYVDVRIAGKDRLRAPSIAEAKKIGEPIAKQLAKEGEDSIFIPPEERRIYVIAKKVIAPFGMDVDEAVRRFAGIQQRLKGENFEKVMGIFEATKQKLKLGIKTPKIFEEYLYDQEVIRGNSEYHVRDVQKFVGKFAKDCSGEILPIVTDQIDDWLRKLGGGARNKNNARKHVIAFFNFGQQKGYLPKDVEHAALGTSIFKNARKLITTEEEALESIQDIEFYQPDEMRKLLAVAGDEIRPSLELKAFSGIRTEEMIRFWWLFVKEAEGIIKVPKEIAKLKFRSLPIVENLQRRLGAYSSDVKQGRVCKEWSSANSLYHAWVRVCKKAGVPYKKNAFRDCYITYRVALTNDPKLVAMECGNSEKMIRENYLHLTTKEKALEWFSL